MHFMKKQVLFMIVLCSLISCTEDVRFNNPSFQVLKENVFWRAVESRASVGTDGSLVIEAYTGKEVITLKVPMPASVVNQEEEGSYITYSLGTSTSKTASYVLTDAGDTMTFTTGFGVGDGQIVITEFGTGSNTVSGVFKFNAENSDGNSSLGSVLNFQKGIFYKVPLK
jgi:hypothetical protein